MIKTEKLEKILKKCHIITDFTADLPDSVLGYYYYDGSYYIILLNECIKDNEKLYRTVLAEEIGHYRTTIGDITPRKYMCYKDRLKVDKYETLALRWASDFMIPTDKILEVMRKNNSITIDELSDSFLVTTEFLIKKFEFMAKVKPMWNIDDERVLYLYNLPSIYVYQNNF